MITDTDEQLTLELPMPPATMPDFRLDIHNVGPVLRRIRVMQGLTQQEVAERADTTPSSISKIENGHRLPALEIVIDLLRAMHYELSLVPMELDD